jgi:hypothetical protein
MSSAAPAVMPSNRPFATAGCPGTAVDPRVIVRIERERRGVTLLQSHWR